MRDYYVNRKGNANGIPVEHLSINIVSQDYIQPQCDAFVDEYGLIHVANDFNSDPTRGLRQTNMVHDSFQQPLTKPVFLIINCVTNSPSHAPNTLLLNQGVTPSDWGQALNTWRGLIDSVEAPPPTLSSLGLANGAIRFTLPGQRGRTNQVLASSNLVDWTVLANFHGTNGPIVFRDTNILSSSRRFYRLRRLE